MNMPEYVWIYNKRQSSEYGRLLIQYTAWDHSTSYWVLIERWVYSEPCQRSTTEGFWKIIIAFNYFHPTFHLQSLRGFWITVGFEICQVSEYSRIVNMLEFWISRVTQGLPISVNITGFWIGVGMQLWKASEYSRIRNIPSFCICEGYTRFWIWLNNAWINCSHYGKVLNMPDQSFTRFWICLSFYICQGLEFGKAVNMQGPHRVLNKSE